MMRNIDVAAHLNNKNYSTNIKIKRVVWGILKGLFKCSPRRCYAFRNSLLRLMGAKIGHNVLIYPSAIIFYPWNFEIKNNSVVGPDVNVYSLGKIRIGSDVILSQGAHLCAGTHDYSYLNLPLLTPPIEIRNCVWVCADAFIGPGLTIAENTLVGARAVVLKDTDPNSIVAGNPAKKLKEWVSRDEYWKYES